MLDRSLQLSQYLTILTTFAPAANPCTLPNLDPKPPPPAHALKNNCRWGCPRPPHPVLQAFNPQFVDQYVGPSKFANVTIELSNVGTGTLDWSLIFVDDAGHSVQPSYGLLSTTTGLIKEGQLVQVTLTTSTYGLVPGTYTSRLQLSTNGACA